MITTVALLTCCIVVLDPRDDVEKPIANDRTQLIGNWTVIAYEDNGEKLDETQCKSFQVSIQPDFGATGLPVSFKLNKTRFSIGRFAAWTRIFDEIIVLDTSSDVKRIEFINGVTKTAVGIYKLEGDQLTICRAKTAAAGFPNEFRSEPNANQILMVLKKVPVESRK